MGITRVFCLFFLCLLTVNAANVWVGSNLYYAAGLYEDDQDTLFTALANAGVKVLRSVSIVLQ